MGTSARSKQILKDARLFVRSIQLRSERSDLPCVVDLNYRATQVLISAIPRNKDCFQTSTADAIRTPQQTVFQSFADVLAYARFSTSRTLTARRRVRRESNKTLAILPLSHEFDASRGFVFAFMMSVRAATKVYALDRPSTRTTGSPFRRPILLSCQLPGSAANRCELLRYVSKLHEKAP